MTTNTQTPEVRSLKSSAFRKQWDAALLDPPWQGQGGEGTYPTLSNTELVTLRPALDALLKDDAWIFVWTTKGLIEPTKHLMAAWGFHFHDYIVWAKPNRYGYGNPKIGIRRATEYLLVGSRGDVRSHFRAQQDFFSEKAGIHAEKPHFQHELIQRLIGPEGRTLELFARIPFDDPDRPAGTPPRWRYWGDQLERCSVSLLPWGWPVPADFLRDGIATTTNLPSLASDLADPKE